MRPPEVRGQGAEPVSRGNYTSIKSRRHACIGAICPGSGFGYGTKAFWKATFVIWKLVRHFSHVGPFLAFQILTNITIQQPLLQHWQSVATPYLYTIVHEKKRYLSWREGPLLTISHYIFKHSRCAFASNYYICAYASNWFLGLKNIQQCSAISHFYFFRMD